MKSSRFSPIKIKTSMEIYSLGFKVRKTRVTKYAASNDNKIIAMKNPMMA